MSTKIYNGYKIKGVRTLGDVQDFMKPVRKRIREMSVAALSRSVAQACTLAIDKLALGEKPMVGFMKPKEYVPKKDGSLASFVVRDLMERYKTSHESHERDPDLELSVCFFPSGRDTLALLFAENEQYVKYWESLARVVKYPYWNNSDAPRGVSQKVWDARGKEWDKAMESSSTPAVGGLNTQCIGLYGLMWPTYEEFKTFVPSFNSRVELHSKERVINARIRSQVERDPKGYREVIDAAHDAYEWADTEDGKKAMASMQVMVCGALKEHLSKEDFLGSK